MRHPKLTAVTPGVLCAVLSFLGGPTLAQGRLFGVNSTLLGDSFLAIIDKTSGAVTQVGPITFQCDGLCFGPDGQLFAADNSSGHLVLLDPASGAVTKVFGPYGAGVTVIEGLALHPTTGILYGIHNSNSGDALVTLDTTTGQATPVGRFGTGPHDMAGLEWSADGSVLYAIQWTNGCLYHVNPQTGLATIIGCGDPGEPLGLAADPANGQLYTTEWHGGGTVMTLATVNSSNGSRVVVGTMGANQIEGLAFEQLVSCPTYCTGKTNSLGCVPAIACAGFATGAASSGFTVSATNVRNQKVGVLLYTLDGREVTPFQNGFLCLAAPIRRTPARNSNGTPFNDCSGGWRIDMNAFAAGAIGGQPAIGMHRPGTTLHCQWWGRDPGDPFGSALTDALRYEIGP